MNEQNSDQAKIKDNAGKAWLYSQIVKHHFFNPRNILKGDELKNFHYNAVGRVGSPACGDEMVIWLKIDPTTKKIIDCRWQTFGCASAIASTSVLSEMILENGGMSLSQAKKIRPQDILRRLDGLPPRKIHCSVLGDQALRAAIDNYKKK